MGYTSTHVALTEDWNGASWAETSDMNTARYLGQGCGTATAGLAYGGYSTTTVAAAEEWSGSSTTIKVLTD